MRFFSTLVLLLSVSAAVFGFTDFFRAVSNEGNRFFKPQRAEASDNQPLQKPETSNVQAVQRTGSPSGGFGDIGDVGRIFVNSALENSKAAVGQASNTLNQAKNAVNQATTAVNQATTAVSQAASGGTAGLTNLGASLNFANLFTTIKTSIMSNPLVIKIIQFIKQIRALLGI